MCLKTFEIPVRLFKREYIPVSRDFVELIGSTLEKVPLTFIDEDGQEFVVDLYPRQGKIGGLGEWYRTYSPTPESKILLELVDSHRGEFKITLDTLGDSRRRHGLFVGRRYNMVASVKYELGPDYFLPQQDLLTHIFVCGIIGSGKTVLAKAIIEEAAFSGIPCIVIDLKGDLSSLGMIPASFEPAEFEPWVEARDDDEKKMAAHDAAERHKDGLSLYRMSERDLRLFKERVMVRVFTPRSSKGLPLSFASQFAAPDNASHLFQEDRETFDQLVSSLTDAFVDRLYPGVKRQKIENERNYLYEIVHHAWLSGIDLGGEEGLRRLLQLVINPPFDFIGVLPVSQYIEAENRRARLLNKINTLLSGPEKIWFEGPPLDIESLITPISNKTNINVINLSEFDHFEDRSFVVAQVAYKIYEWMRKQRGTDQPRLLFFIDEIGGGGGKQALFPSYPYECAAKWGLNYLVRQGRAFGVCCMFATQNPGDIDYRALSNCNTWMIGGLGTKRDRDKVMEGMALRSGDDAKWVEINITNAKEGQFVVRSLREDKPFFIHERWLRTYHRVLTLEEVSRLPRI